MKDGLGGIVMAKLVGLRAKTYSYLIDDGIENKKANDTKKCVTKKQKQKKKENYKNYLEATQLENKINYLKKRNRQLFCYKRKHKKFIKDNKLILKTQQRFKSERYNV